MFLEVGSRLMSLYGRCVFGYQMGEKKLDPFDPDILFKVTEAQDPQTAISLGL